MESDDSDRRLAAETLAALDATQSALVDDVHLPPGYLPVIGGAVAVQIGTLAWSLGAPGGRTVAAAAAAAVLLLVVIAWQVRRFRATNGVSLDGFVHKAAFGTTVSASVSYAAGLGFATWAAFTQTWWLVPPVAAVAGAGYAVAGERWLRRYRARPATEAAGPPWPLAVLAVAGALAGLVLLLMQR
jgi:hypothetical protein